jgi:aspartate racemase
MKTIGLIGGMSWESTITYYRIINEEVQKRAGGVHSARILMHSFDFDDIVALQRAGDWTACNEVLARAGQGLAQAGADFLLICTNTMQLCAAVVEKRAGVPVLHMADPLGKAIARAGLTRVGLLGTRFTMERPDVLRARLKTDFDLEVLTPDGDDAGEVHRVIYEELCCGRFIDSSRARYREIIARLVARGAEGVILGCTEIPLLVSQKDSAVPLFDTTTLHAMAAVDLALS